MWVATWNVEWATPRSRRTGEILRRLNEFAPEIVCLTETDPRLLSEGGHVIRGQADCGYGARWHRRKVMLWSREPWYEVDDVGQGSLPPGRFVSGVTLTSVGEVWVVGVCIPWFGSRTEARRGSGRRKRWEDHKQYLVGLREVLSRNAAEPTIVLGDFNQVIGAGGRAPRELQLALQEIFSCDIEIATSSLEFHGRKSVDHIAMSGDLKAESLNVLSNKHDGRKLSDHFGVAAEVNRL